MIGAFGDIVFSVSRETARTLKDLTRTESGRYATHDIHLKKPKLEFLGPGLSTLSFKMEFDANLGVNPRKETDSLIRMQREGRYGLFILGGRRIGMGYFVLKSVNVDYKRIDNKGNMLAASADVTLEEYV
ncbi:hypothetical protein GCM10007425_29600 [Lysinibacillus alkalisoli]|uniref:Phage tail protein n=1 Tax=Lysinibacillus alkalisoli TaxID=1911548 RepID=A0A917LJS8_9BACI|nr:phage tail protein [Lysinibacillus alkalisoli]GGG32994.1 hypothetical protein GCM10007425_29600 [Lysinibacillus alkalisoli]